MLLQIFKTFFEMLWVMARIPVYFLLFYAACFIVACLIQMAAFRIQGRKLSRSGVVRKVRSSHGLLRSIFVDVPIRYVKDLYERKAGTFPYKGVVVFTGPQGNGKTISAVQFVRKMHEEYPRSKLITNCDLQDQDLPLMDWKPLVTEKNGIYGMICLIDETQNWFSSNQSKDFPPEMLQVVTQNRKNRRIIVGTSQVFSRMSKPLREQVSEVRECYTFLGCFTVVIRRRPKIDYEGNVEKMKYLGMYFFVHDDDLRNSYDTYKVIDSLAASGFQPRQSDNVVNLNQTFVQNKKGRK